MSRSELVFVKEKDSKNNATSFKDSITVTVEKGIYDFAFKIEVDMCDYDGDWEFARIGLTREEALEMCNDIIEQIKYLDEFYKEVE